MKRNLNTKKNTINKTKHKPTTKTTTKTNKHNNIKVKNVRNVNYGKKQKRTKKLISNKNTKYSKIVNSEKYKTYLQNRIKYNIHKFNMSSYKSKKQAIAISYNQTNTFFNLY